MFGQLDIVRQQLTLAGEARARREAESVVAYVQSTIDTDWCPLLESPLEAVFWLWWVSMRDCMDPCFVLKTQQDVVVDGQRFRLDFVVAFEERGEAEEAEAAAVWKPIAVEVDGHAFHEKTPAQVADRNTRDRILQQAGWTVFHFSWSELVTRGEECVTEVLVAATKRRYPLAWTQINPTE